MVNKQIIKNIFLFTLWTAIGTGTVVLLVAAIQQKDAKKCTDVNIVIKGVSDNFFVDKNDILNTITLISGGNPEGKQVGSFNLKAIETALQKNVWVKSAQLFFDNNERLQVNVLEREPVSRVFTTGGNTFYIDSTVTMLPLSEKYSARLPVFTNFPSDQKVPGKADSNLLKDIYTISSAIREDSFYMALIDQVDITPQRTFEMIPKFGNTVIVFGDATNASEKLRKIQLFYKEVILKAGWNKYSEINVQYNNQVVAKRKGADEVKADSLRTLQLMQVIAENSERLAADSLQTIMPDNEHNTTNNNIIQQSIERDDHNASANTIEESLSQADTLKTKPSLPAPLKGTVAKPAIVHKLVEILKKPLPVNQGGVSKKPVAGNKPDATPQPTETKKPGVLMPAPPHKKPAVVKQANEY